ncbi:MAG: HAMP domain-containing histidine kinase [Oceanicaulis sp.]|nr:HAMP domain-containing histidine kinase [Oceanicaulis sp.]
MSTDRERRTTGPAAWMQAGAARAVGAVRSLPGKLLIFSVLFVMVAEVMIFFPSASSFRTEWLAVRAEAAHLAALAAETAEADGLSEARVRELLAGADAVAVARVYGGVNELVLGGEVEVSNLIVANLMRETLIERQIALWGTFFAPEGRHIRIVAAPRTRPDEQISVIVPEAGLRDDLIAFSVRIFWLSLFIAGVTGVLLYGVLMVIFVRPMRRLAMAITAFQKDPGNPALAFTPSGRRDEIGEAETALAAMQDEVRAAFRQRERLAALGGAVARINHDLRNVLASAQLVSDRLAMSQDSRVANMGARLVRAVDRGVRLCQETLEFGRAQERAPVFSRIQLRPALDEAAGDAMAATGRADWDNRIDDALAVQADPDHLHRIFLNLFRNAIQAMEGGGAVSAALAREEGGHVVIAVSDTGPGVPDHVRETLFEPFGRSGAKGGAGLGLSIARELARAMGGDVILADSGAAGAVFEVTLRAAQEPPQRSADPVNRAS